MTEGDPDGLPPETGWRDDVARRWAAELSTTSYLPLPREDVVKSLADLLDQLVLALADPEKAAEVGRVVGARLVEIRATGEESLSVSLRVLQDALLSDGVEVDALLSVLTEVAAGYAAADRENTFAQQETLNKALLSSKLKTDRELKASEARFSEVFTSTPIGVAITDLDGRFVQVNPAFERLLGYHENDLAPMCIDRLFHPEDAEYLSASYRELVEGASSTRLSDRKRLVRADGEPAWCYLGVSVLHGADGTPCGVVTMVEDITELHLLQDRFQHQALHDALTGLPNRGFFQTRLEAALVNLPRDARLALYQLGLDGFELINDGLGYAVGDQLIRTVARRLEHLVEDEEALVSRFGGTEFALLIWEQADSPSVPVMTQLINEMLAEPVYVGGRGIAATASIGVVQRTVGEADAANLLWAADVALRRAEAAGKRQWALFDPDLAPEEREESQLAAIMPGGLEMGEFDVVYRPSIRLSGRELCTMEAEFRWDTGDFGVIEHADCLRLAERSGVTLSMRDWMLQTAWQHLADWHADGHRVALSVSLSPNQGRDPDLAAVVHKILDESELDPSWLRLCLPIAAISENEEARENLRHLRSRGIRASLHDFTGSPGELRLLREMPVDSVRLSPDVIRLVHAAESPDVPEIQALRALIPLLGDVRLCVDHVETEEQLALWRDVGCLVAAGPLFGQPLLSFDVPAALA
ncbi:putative bifunctional diguanylate cyclase/phosphodiesterase [Saccharopolyspora flava]|uniref:Diguanylate cyclase/phosphodiesterase with PAS/PAC sensor(S) n=1 Tax=Saccharopolyspora flava TaxID=95161 RepID=A0A1I6NX48_9PSEU|nr:EAL domain-containing protein [Saccharopolyspora flava]SFS32455.1 diguanylate cyclase/phosphodiesterase with PAS/PAC sensor(s) [Saccharopolyspora flava]